MPKNTKMSKGAQADANDDDVFEKMLAEMTAADPQLPADNSN
jgi:hypothetical protein